MRHPRRESCRRGGRGVLRGAPCPGRIHCAREVLHAAGGDPRRPPAGGDGPSADRGLSDVLGVALVGAVQNTVVATALGGVGALLFGSAAALAGGLPVGLARR